MSRVKSWVLYVWHLRFLKYVLAIVVGVLVVGFWGENSVLGHLRHKQEIGNLEEQIDKYTEQSEKDMKRIRELEHNPKAVEQIARERYLMKTDDEDIFVMSSEVEEEEIDD